MQISKIIVSAALNLSQPQPTNPGTLGFALGSTRPDGLPKLQADYEYDFTSLAAASTSRLVRTYVAEGTASAILPAANATGFHVLLGMTPDDARYEIEKQAIIQADIQQYNNTVVGITVGSEGILRNSYNVSTLRAWIEDMKTLYPDTAIGTADVWASWQSGALDFALAGQMDLVLINDFTYWDGLNITDAPAQFRRCIDPTIDHIVAKSSRPESLRVMIGETGWPGDGGSPFEQALPGNTNEEFYWNNVLCPYIADGHTVFWFEAFDEPNKPSERGTNASFWGAMTKDHVSKFSLACQNSDV